MAAATAVIGYGVTGQGAVNYLASQAESVVVLDTRPWPDTLPTIANVEFLFECDQWPAIEVSRAILSPGLGLDSDLVAGAKEHGVPLVSDIDVFFGAVEQPVIGITGTNGKSTVTSLVAHLLNAANVQALAGGNLGPAALALIPTDGAVPAVYVLELSSFQLERSDHHPYAAATTLNVTEDHIDQHGDFETYKAAKQRIYHSAQRCVWNRADMATQPPQGGISFGLDAPPSEQDFGMVERDGQKVLVCGENLLCAVDALPFVGEHNILNALAAAALTTPFLSLEQIGEGLKTFVGLAHRFQTVLEHDGVLYIDDSKATNVGATIAALVGLTDVVLIAGGDAKGADLAPLKDAFKGSVKAVVTLGKDGDKIANLARELELPQQTVSSMAEVVSAAQSFADCGDMILLSPACSSLDMFASFGERGRVFQQMAAQLTAQTAGGADE